MRLFGRDRVDDLELRVNRLARRVDMLIDHLGVELDESVLTDSQQESIRLLLANGRKVDAIRAYRQATGEGLREARAAIEEMRREFPGPPA